MPKFYIKKATKIIKGKKPQVLQNDFLYEKYFTTIC